MGTNHFISIFFVCFFVFNAFARSAPPENNELMEHSYSGLLTQSLPSSVSRFTINTVQKLHSMTPESNIFWSPINAYAALLLLHLGAGERTRARLNEVLKLHESYHEFSKLHETFSDIFKKLEHKPSSHHDDTEVTIANGFFMQKDYPIFDSFIESVKKYYSANVTNLDFVGGPEEAMNFINSFISEHTKHRIEQFYKDPLPSNTISVLASALYFKGRWAHVFEEQNTQIEKFNTGTKEIDVSMMHSRGRIQYSYSEALQFDSIELKYKGDEYSMLIQLPRPGQTLKNLTDYLHTIDVHELNRNSRMTGVSYKIPKMKFKWESSLVGPLDLDDIFRNVDLSHMTSRQNVRVSDMKQVAEIEVDEHGTIATAVTTLNMISRKFTPVENDDDIKFYADRPFMVNIVHQPTQMVVFSGHVYNPIQ